MSVFIGVDPGITGGIAVLDHDGYIIGLHAMPTMPGPIAKRQIVDARKLGAMLKGGTHVAVEQVGARPGQSVVGMFSFGTSYGIVLGVLGSMGISHQFVMPQRWQKHHALSADKEATIGWAMRRWPELTLRKKDDGLADALAIADWLRATHGGTK